MKDVFDAFEPHAAWFRHSPHGIHGIAHEARVLVWAEVLIAAQEKRGISVDRDVVRCAAIVHDVGRLNDGRDSEHGARSALWVAKNARLLPVALTTAQLDAVQYCCEWHVPPDEDCPKLTAELTCLKDADGLDRVRIDDLDPTRLRLEAARQLVGLAESLLDQSMRNTGTSWERVRAAALHLGLWR